MYLIEFYSFIKNVSFYLDLLQWNHLLRLHDAILLCIQTYLLISHINQFTYFADKLIYFLCVQTTNLLCIQLFLLTLHKIIFTYLTYKLIYLFCIQANSLTLHTNPSTYLHTQLLQLKHLLTVIGCDFTLYIN